jgi:hypothetical protein
MLSMCQRQGCHWPALTLQLLQTRPVQLRVKMMKDNKCSRWSEFFGFHGRAEPQSLPYSILPSYRYQYFVRSVFVKRAMKDGSAAYFSHVSRDSAARLLHPHMYASRCWPWCEDWRTYKRTSYQHYCANSTTLKTGWRRKKGEGSCSFRDTEFLNVGLNLHFVYHPVLASRPYRTHT